MKRLLLTGFGPFLGEKINPSQAVLDSLPANSAIKKIILPVSYERSFELVRRELVSGDFDRVIMLGQAGGRNSVCVERFSVNLMDSEIPDADGVLAREQKISSQADLALTTAFPLRDWLESAKEKKLPLEISNSAGTYVCNYLSFRVAEEFSSQAVKSLFVHLPFLPEQLSGKPEGAPALKLSQMIDAVEFILMQS